LNSIIKHDQPWQGEVKNDGKKPTSEMAKTAAI
jgi:hypothetical protein